VSRHGGDIVVSSAIGEGTVFLVYLPASDQEAAGPRSAAVPAVPSGLRVLVMDDDPQVVRVLSAFLSKTGQAHTEKPFTLEEFKKAVSEGAAQK
jgi:hypothetical protein